MIIVKTIEAILEQIQALLPDVPCERSYLPEASIEELEDISKPIIYVYPSLYDCEKATQSGSREHTLGIGVAINKKLINMNQRDKLLEEIDELINIYEKIYTNFIKKVKIGKDNLRIVADQPQNDMFHDIDCMRDHNCYLAIIQILVNVYEIINTENDKK
jgi:hypothetical protein